VVSIREASAGRRANGSGFDIYGTKASMSLSRSGFEVTPDMRIPAENQIPPWSNPAGHPARSNAQPVPWTQPLKGTGSQDEQMELHARNFLDCIKSRRRPAADVEDGHRVSAACHLANISLRTGRKLRWDAEREEILGDKEASAMLERPYRKPWDAVLRSLNL
jgi:predicted dehydrogenase